MASCRDVRKEKTMFAWGYTEYHLIKSLSCVASFHTFSHTWEKPGHQFDSSLIARSLDTFVFPNAKFSVLFAAHWCCNYSWCTFSSTGFGVICRKLCPSALRPHNSWAFKSGTTFQKNHQRLPTITAADISHYVCLCHAETAWSSVLHARFLLLFLLILLKFH